jgi:hypothetical protein
MRNGILWAIALLCVNHTFAVAQESSNSAATTKLPEVNVGAVQDLTKPALAAPVVIYTDNQPVRPLGIWVKADYLLWWVKGGPLASPIVTTSTNFTDLVPAALGMPNTHVLFGDRPMGYGASSGMRFTAGIDLNDELALEGSFFSLQRRTFRYKVASDAAGNPMLGIANFNTAIGLEDALLTSNPDPNVGPWAGAVSIDSTTRLQGWDLNLATTGSRFGAWNVKGIVGFRSLNLTEDLTIHNNFTPLVDGVLTFLGPTVAPGNLLMDNDHFSTSNSFYGGQIGGTLGWQQGAFSADVSGKVAFGATQQIVTIAGASTLVNPAGVPTVAPGGIFAEPSNIGRYYKSTFSVIPEVGVNLGWNLTPNIKATFGYTFLYWSQVARPGDQIDHGVNQTLVPTHQFYGTNTADGRPAFSFRESSFWAQGISFGLEFKY